MGITCPFHPQACFLILLRGGCFENCLIFCLISKEVGGCFRKSTKTSLCCYVKCGATGDSLPTAPALVGMMRSARPLVLHRSLPGNLPRPPRRNCVLLSPVRQEWGGGGKELCSVESQEANFRHHNLATWGPPEPNSRPSPGRLAESTPGSPPPSRAGAQPDALAPLNHQSFSLQSRKRADRIKRRQHSTLKQDRAARITRQAAV